MLSSSYKKPNYSGQFMEDTFLRSGWKALSFKNLYIADGTKKLCSATIAGLQIKLY